jgi:hypothetical protein
MTASVSEPRGVEAVRLVEDRTVPVRRTGEQPAARPSTSVIMQ